MTCCVLAIRCPPGVSNVFAQHTPLLKDTLDAVQRGRLSKTTFPYVTGAEAPARYACVHISVANAPPQHPAAVTTTHEQESERERARGERKGVGWRERERESESR